MTRIGSMAELVEQRLGLEVEPGTQRLVTLSWRHTPRQSARLSLLVAHLGFPSKQAFLDDILTSAIDEAIEALEEQLDGLEGDELARELGIIDHVEEQLEL